MEISPVPMEVSTAAKNFIRKNIGYFKSCLRGAELAFQEQVVCSYAKSLAIYTGTPLVAAGIWSRKDIEAIESELFREAYLLPRDISRAVVVNIETVENTGGNRGRFSS